jgi:hypothetical protein
MIELQPRILQPKTVSDGGSGSKAAHVFNCRLSAFASCGHAANQGCAAVGHKETHALQQTDCYSITSSAVARSDDGCQFHRALGRLGCYSLINRLDKLGLVQA